jgi:hypothetical protein
MGKEGTEQDDIRRKPVVISVQGTKENGSDERVHISLTIVSSAQS